MQVHIILYYTGIYYLNIYIKKDTENNIL